MLNGASHVPFPAPGLLPPSHPTPSEVGDGRSGERGRVTLLPLGGPGGGGVRAAELPRGGSGGRDGAMLSLGANYAQPGEAERGLATIPGLFPLSRPDPSKVGEGLSIQGDGGGGVRSMSFSDLWSLLNAAHNNASSLAKNRHLSAPTEPTTTPRLRKLKLCFILTSVLVQSQ